MMQKAWWKESVVYQIYPRSFNDSNGDGIGDLKGIIEKLDYLNYLGVNVIWLSPVYQSPNDDNGYDISDYQKIMEEFGAMDNWTELVEKIHKRGMKIVMDLVVNHTSNEHPWFVEASSSLENPKHDYYIWGTGKDGREPNNWASFFGGSAWQYNSKTKQYFLHLFSKKQPDLNWENPVLRQEIYNMMAWWLDKGTDGFRMDVINLISKVPGLSDAPQVEGKRYQDGSRYYTNGPRIHQFLQEMNKKVLSKYDVFTVGEMPGVDVEDAVLYTSENNHEVNMIFQFEHMEIDDCQGSKWNCKPWSLKDLKQIINKWQTGLEGKGWNSLYLNNHDRPRMVSRFGNDTVYRVESAKMLATFLHMLSGTPYIYQGEEIGMTNVKFPSIDDYRDIETLNMYHEKVIENGENKDEIMKRIYHKGRDNARTPFQWNDGENAGFTDGIPWIKVNPNYKKINAEAVVKDSNSIFHYYRKLIQLRKENELVVYGSYRVILEEDKKIYAFIRELKQERWLVILNFSAETAVFHLPQDIKYVKAELIIRNYLTSVKTNIDMISLQPYEACVYRLL
jgi:oligo-1,6-glucosidase